MNEHIISRRLLISGAAALVSAPAIVKADSLMPVRPAVIEHDTPWPIMLNGRCYTHDDFYPYGYVDAIPRILKDMAAVAERIQSDNVTLRQIVARLDEKVRNR